MSDVAQQGLDWLLLQEDCDNDDRRFYCSYLIGHISLALADAETDTVNEKTSNDESFLLAMQQNLATTLSEDNLDENDKAGINHLWDEVCSL
jgi:hypothetical protein